MSIRTVEEIEALEGKTYSKLTLLQHLPNFKRIYPNATDQTRTLAAFVYYVLYEQITGTQKSQTGCAAEFRSPMMPFKRLITGKKQPGGPGRSKDAGRSVRTIEEVEEIKDVTPAKNSKPTPTPKQTKGRGKGRGKRTSSK